MRLPHTPLRLPTRRFLAVEPQRQALGTAAGLNEFRKGRLNRSEAARGEVAMQIRAAAVGDDGAADDNGVTGEGMGFFGRDGDELRHKFLQHRAAVVVKRAGKVDGLAGSERAEAGIKVIVMPVD